MGAGPGRPEAMLFCDLDAERARSVADEVGGETRDSLPELARDCEVLVLAVKPGALGEVAEELAARAPALISILAATPTAVLADAFPGVPALRLMPNQPVEVRRGVLCYVAAAGMPAELLARLLALLEPLGELVPLEERLIDPAMAVMSARPRTSRWSPRPWPAAASGRAWTRSSPGSWLPEHWPEPRSSWESATRRRSAAPLRRRAAPPRRGFGSSRGSWKMRS